MYEIYSIPGFAEPVASWTHLLGAMGFLFISLYTLIRHGKTLGRIVTVLIFGFCSVFLLSMSGVYHLLSTGQAQDVLQILDHAAIFALIAGTFTAVHALVFQGVWRWGMIVLVWVLAAAGIGLKSIFFSATPEWLGLILYVGMGWLGAISGYLLLQRFAFKQIRPLLWGGLAYTAGAILEFSNWPLLVTGVIGPHELFHAAVLAGLGFHWYFVVSYLSQTSKESAPKVFQTHRQDLVAN